MRVFGFDLAIRLPCYFFDDDDEPMRFGDAPTSNNPIVNRRHYFDRPAHVLLEVAARRSSVDSSRS